MDEIKSAFYSDVKSKSITAHGSHNIRRKYDNNKRYTRKEWKKMNGATYTMNINEFIPFKEFRKLPDAMQKEWIEAQIKKYGVCKTSFAKLWDVDPSTPWKMFKQLGINSPKANAKKEKKFLREMKPKAEKPMPTLEPPVTSNDTITPETDTPNVPNADFVVDLIQIDTDAKFENHEEVFRFFSRFISLNANMHITLRIEKKDEVNK